MRHLIGLAAALVVLSACDRPAEPAEAPVAPAAPAANAFRYAATSDLSGYYLPHSEVRNRT